MVPRRRHLWEFQPVRDLLWLVGIIGIIYVGHLASIVTVPLLLGLLLSYLTEPMLARAMRLHRAFTRGRIIFALVLVLIALLLTSVFTIVPALVQQAERLIAARGTYAHAIERAAEQRRLPESLRSALHQAAQLLSTSDQGEKKPEDKPGPPPGQVGEKDIRDLVAHEVALRHPLDAAQRPTELAAQAIGAIIHMLGGVLVFCFGLFLTFFFFVSFSVSWPSVQAFFVDCIPPQRRERVLHLASSLDAVVAGFVRGRLTIAAILCVMYVLGWWILDVPYALLLGVATGIAILIPYMTLLGLLAAYASIIAAALNDPTSVPLYANEGGIRWLMLLILPAIPPAIGQILDDYVLTPVIQGKVVHLSTPLLVAVVVAGGAIAGLYGMLLAIPAAGCIRILFKEVLAPRLKAWSQELPPPASES